MAQPVQYLPDDPGDPGNPGGTPTNPPPSSYGTQVFGFSFDKLDSGSVLRIIAYLNCYNQDDLRFSAYAFIDGNVVQVGTVNALFDQSNSQAQQTMTLVAYVLNIAAGTRTFELRVKNRETEGPLVVQAGSVAEITELRQGAR